MKQNKRHIGSLFEERASEFLCSKGYRILEMNFRCKSGEIDIIAMDGNCLCFIEVKYRRSGVTAALEAVNHAKQKQIRDVAQFYILKNGLSLYTTRRFDVVAITDNEIALIKNAFE